MLHSLQLHDVPWQRIRVYASDNVSSQIKNIDHGGQRANFNLDDAVVGKVHSRVSEVRQCTTLDPCQLIECQVPLENEREQVGGNLRLSGRMKENNSRERIRRKDETKRAERVGGKKHRKIKPVAIGLISKVILVKFKNGKTKKKHKLTKALRCLELRPGK